MSKFNQSHIQNLINENVFVKTESITNTQGQLATTYDQYEVNPEYIVSARGGDTTYHVVELLIAANVVGDTNDNAVGDIKLKHTSKTNQYMSSAGFNEFYIAKITGTIQK